jgi:hypothetical protein
MQGTPDFKALEGIVVRRVPTSADLLHPGEYVFIEKRPPQVTIEKTPLYHAS